MTDHLPKRPRCAATHPERYHQCQLREGHKGPHRAWGGGREHSDNLTWDRTDQFGDRSLVASMLFALNVARVRLTPDRPEIVALLDTVEENVIALCESIGADKARLDFLDTCDPRALTSIFGMVGDGNDVRGQIDREMAVASKHQ
jgi:hypothetical protein